MSYGLQIVTGRTGTPHITSYQMQSLYRGLFGDFALLQVGERFEAEKRSKNLVWIKDGVMLFQGVYAIIPYGEVATVNIENVEPGYKRIDVICVQYYKDISDDTEQANIVVVKGTASTNPVAPDVTDGDRWYQDDLIQVPLYNVLVELDDITIIPYERMTKEYPSLNDLSKPNVTKDYVDKMILDLKRESAKASNNKFNESAIPSQYVNKLYVYGNPESMYPVNEVGRYINIFPSGRTTADYHWDGQETRSNWVINDYKIYGKDESTNIIYDKLFAAKCINPADTRLACYVVLSAHKDVEIIANPNYASSPWNSIIRNASGSVAEDRSKMYMMMWDAVVTPPRPREFEEISMQERFTGNLIADNYFKNYQYYNCQVTGMPLFVINSNSQSEFDKINRYIKENDYSGAVNASELGQYHKDSIVAIDVISGNWYNIVNDTWVKQGTLDWR